MGASIRRQLGAMFVLKILAIARSRSFSAPNTTVKAVDQQARRQLQGKSRVPVLAGTLGSDLSSRLAHSSCFSALTLFTNRPDGSRSL